MFEHFTFGARPQIRNQLDDAFPSPTDTSSQFTPPPTSFPFAFPSLPNQSGINDIVAKLSQQTLQQRSRDELVKRFRVWQDDSPAELEVDDEEMDTPSEQETSETMSLPPTPTSANVSCRRLQRQLNVQMQSCETHMRDINALVKDMILNNSQCRIMTRPYLPSPPPSRGRDEDLSVDPSPELDEASILAEEIDEGFCEDEPDEEDSEMSLRRASTPSGIRKHNLRYGRSADVVTVGGKTKVRSLPRMRKRKLLVSRKE